VRDMTEGSTLTTWYNTDYSPAVAVTTHTDDKPKGLKQALEVLDKDPQQPRPAPLTQLSSADNAEVCTSLMDEIPDTVGEDYERFAVTEEITAEWGAEGRNPMVIPAGLLHRRTMRRAPSSSRSMRSHGSRTPRWAKAPPRAPGLRWAVTRISPSAPHRM